VRIMTGLPAEISRDFMLVAERYGPAQRARRLSLAGVRFGFAGTLTRGHGLSLFSDEGSGAWRINLAAHRCSNLLSRSRGIELITETPGF
jgi:hypothetical protein